MRLHHEGYVAATLAVGVTLHHLLWRDERTGSLLVNDTKSRR